MPSHREKEIRRIAAMRKVTAASRLEEIARINLEVPVRMGKDAGLTRKEIGIAILRGALGIEIPVGDDAA